MFDTITKLFQAFFGTKKPVRRNKRRTDVVHTSLSPAITSTKSPKAEIPKLPEVLKDYVLWDRRFRRSYFGATAVKLGFLTETQLDILVAEQSKTDLMIGEFAIKRGFLTKDQVEQCLSAQKINIFVEDSRAGDPVFLTWINDCRRAEVSPVIQRTDQKGIAKLREDGFGVSSENHADIGLNTLNRAKALIQECAVMGGSDIHIIVRERFAEVQVRVKGELKSVQTMTRFEGDSVIRAIYTGLSSVKEAMINPYEYQDAQINGEAIPGAALTSIRVIRGPCYPVEQGGQFMVARLQYDNRKESTAIEHPTLVRKVPTIPDGKFALESMGYTKHQIKALEMMTHMPSGVIMVTGPTGSGKTSTIYQLMMHQARNFPGSRQITVENPVEYPMEWAIQLPIVGAKNDAESGAGYMNAVRMTLRMDPDIILLGELRGGDEGVAALQAAMTGHLVWTTIHVTDPYMTIDRLEQLDNVRLARGVVCDNKVFRGIVSQRLVSRLCPHCKVPAGTVGSVPLVDDVHNIAELWHKEFIRRKDDAFAVDSKPDIYVRGSGCEFCGGDAITGVSAVAEVVATDPELMSVFREKGTSEARIFHRKREGSDLSMLGNAMRLVSMGLVDPYDVSRAIDIIVAPGKE